MTMVVVFLMTLSDSIVAGQILGEHSLIGISLDSPLISITAFLCMMIGTGTAYRFSFELGAFRKQRANAFAGQGFILSAALSVLLFLAGFFGRELFFRLIAPSEDALFYAAGYYTYLPPLMLLYPFYILLQDLVYADGAGRLCVVAGFIQLTVNVISSVVACERIGIAGVSLGTLIGTVTAIVLYLTRLFSKSTSLRFTPHFTWADVLTVLRYSYVHASLYLYWGVAWLMLNRFFIARYGEVFFPVITVMNNLLLLTLVFDGVGQAAEPILNVYLGEQNPDGVRKVMRVATRTALLEGLAAASLLLITGGNLARVFNIDSPELLRMSGVAIRIYAPAMPFLSLLYLYTMFYLLTGHFRLSAAISVCKDLLLLILLPVLGGMLLDISGMWIGWSLVSVVTMLLLAVILRFHHSNSLLMPDEPDICSADAVLTQEQVISLRDWGADCCDARGIDPSAKQRVMLLIEELGMLIVDKNVNRPPLCEVTLFFRESIGVIFRDNGVHFDVTDTDANLSLRSYLVNRMLEQNSHYGYLLTHNYNRNVFHIPRKNPAAERGEQS